jgi:hypothetical protein
MCVTHSAGEEAEDEVCVLGRMGMLGLSGDQQDFQQ